MKCDELEQWSSLYLYDELAPGARADLEAHIAACETCGREFGRIRSLHAMLRECPQPEPSPALVAHCRQALDEALDREQLGWRAMLRAWFWSAGPIPASRAGAVAALVLLGFGLGWTLRPRVSALQPVTNAGQTAAFDLDNERIRKISQVAQDPQSGGVRITLDAERRVTMEGSLDDPHIREVLVNAVKSYDNPGIRRDTLDVLRGQTHDPTVREALMYALHDGNPGVRLAALKTVNHMECGYDTHRALLKVVEKDPNVGVRSAAIDALVEHLEAEGPDDEVTTAFEKLASADQNPYIQMRCLAALRKLQGNERR
jgi:hypothetical protein